ncbi:SDR family NAD(P)-dependent oxidoreductase [Mesorhizobium sp. M0145]|uniref:SDR family NAD(P)-dependent oxidoreductase n=1 Tax=Mesorhizobium sp. M0145 TaxID=2956895 RepID=UPI00333A14D9
MQANVELQGLRVAVTGGTSGLGLAFVRQLAAMNACVAFVARTAANVLSRLGRLRREQGRSCPSDGDLGRGGESRRHPAPRA